jgi:hypothetical protein
MADSARHQWHRREGIARHRCRGSLCVRRRASAEGQQSSFGRIRIRAAGVIDGATYKVTHPFGTDTIVAETGAVKGINVTEDIGDLVGGSNFEGALGSRPAPFLKWDATAPAAPAGYLGDPTVEHSVTGSPYNTNVFRIEGPWAPSRVRPTSARTRLWATAPTPPTSVTASRPTCSP